MDFIIKPIVDYVSYYLPLIILILIGLFLAIFGKVDYSDEEKSVSVSHRIRKN